MFAIVRSSDLGDRWDADYHVRRVNYVNRIKWLRENATRKQLWDVARLLSFDLDLCWSITGKSRQHRPTLVNLLSRRNTAAYSQDLCLQRTPSQWLVMYVACRLDGPIRVNLGQRIGDVRATSAVRGRRLFAAMSARFDKVIADVEAWRKVPA